MKKIFEKLSSRNFNLVFIFILLSVLLIKIPTGFENQIDKNAIRVKGQIISVNNSQIFDAGLIKTGDQRVTIKILKGKFKNKTIEAQNQLLGQMDRDKIFKSGDKVFTVLTLNEDEEIIYASAREHYRLGLEFFLFLLFALLLAGFGGFTGIKALVSFVFSGLVIWKILIPMLLKGYDPILTTFLISSLLCGAIIFLVAGINKKGLTALAGSFAGVFVSCIMALYFTSKFHIHGAIMPFAETLLYSGFAHLNLTKIYTGAVFIACSGAVMDLAMDVSASMEEIKKKKPDISAKELIKSGLSVGRTVTGTMTTTLLLAYSGGYITLLMAFMAQGIHLSTTFNLVYVSAEILKTLAGSFGLVTVAPFTAIAGGFIFSFKSKKRENLTVKHSVNAVEDLF
jgi:uncharacterized membrane protein